MKKKKKVKPQNGPREVVYAEEFRLVDSDGKLRGLLTAANDDSTPYFEMYDSDGLQRLSMCVERDGSPRVVLMRRDGGGSIGIAVTDDEGAGLSISDQDGIMGLMVTIDAKSQRVVASFSQNGECISQTMWR